MWLQQHGYEAPQPQLTQDGAGGAPESGSGGEPSGEPGGHGSSGIADGGGSARGTASRVTESSTWTAGAGACRGAAAAAAAAAAWQQPQHAWLQQLPVSPTAAAAHMAAPGGPLWPPPFAAAPLDAAPAHAAAPSPAPAGGLPGDRSDAVAAMAEYLAGAAAAPPVHLPQLARAPRVGGAPLDLRALFQAVVGRGGGAAVARDGRWPEVLAALGLVTREAAAAAAAAADAGGGAAGAGAGGVVGALSRLVRGTYIDLLLRFERMYDPEAWLAATGRPSPIFGLASTAGAGAGAAPPAWHVSSATPRAWSPPAAYASALALDGDLRRRRLRRGGFGAAGLGAETMACLSAAAAATATAGGAPLPPLQSPPAASTASGAAAAQWAAAAADACAAGFGDLGSPPAARKRSFSQRGGVACGGAGSRFSYGAIGEWLLSPLYGGNGTDADADAGADGYFQQPSAPLSPPPAAKRCASAHGEGHGVAPAPAPLGGGRGAQLRHALLSSGQQAAPPATPLSADGPDGAGAALAWPGDDVLLDLLQQRPAAACAAAAAAGHDPHRQCRGGGAAGARNLDEEAADELLDSLAHLF